MRICNAFQCLIAGVVLGYAGTALAFDPTNLNPDTPPSEAFEYGLNSYRQGDKATAIEALGFAANKGHPLAQWQLGRMYAEGDGTKRDDYKAFEYFSEIANAHADDGPNEPNARFVSSAFVALGGYYKNGIPDTNVKADASRARQIYAYAASYYGDPDAQFNLARMYYSGEGGERDPLSAARWAKLAADKGNVNAQALFGHVLFQGDGVQRQPVLGLMYLTIARERAKVGDRWIYDMHEEAVSLATENERRTAMAMAEDWLSKNAKATN